MDRDYRYTFSNNQLFAVFPGAASRIVGRSGDEVLGTETFDRIRPHMDRATAGEPQVFEITHPPSGRRIRIALTPDPTGRGAYVLSTDVTAEVQSREALTHAAKAVQIVGMNTLKEIAEDPLLSGRTLPTRLQVLAQHMARHGWVTPSYPQEGGNHDSEDGTEGLLRNANPPSSESEVRPKPADRKSVV